MTIIESVRAYICGCPLLDEDGKVGVDWLGKNPVEYVIEEVPGTPIVKYYADGGTLRQFVFLFASREAYSADVLNNMSNCGFYERFRDWLEQQDERGFYPELTGKLPVKIEATTCGYIFDAAGDSARYQIQCRLLYQQ